MFRMYQLIILLFLSGSMIFGQGEDMLNKDPWIKKTFAKGVRFKQQKNYGKALKQFDRIIKKYPGYLPAYKQKATVFYSQDKMDLSAKSLEEIISLDSFFDVNIYFSLGHVYERLAHREKALAAYQSFVKYSSEKDSNFNKALKKVERINFVLESMRNPVPFEPFDPGPNINTKMHESLASINLKGDEMVFTRLIDRQEDLYVSHKKDGIWLQSQPIKELNSPYNEGAHCLSPDGQYLYFTVCENWRTLGNCDLVVSKKEMKAWSSPENLGKKVNSGSWDSQPVVSADGNTLYFTSTRPGGLGGRDIWYSQKDRSGNWSIPLNVGEPINTKGNEESPFLHPDGKHLYFMSDGHTGMGGYDLFLSLFEDNTWGNPVNLGYPINTEQDEGAIRVASDGKTAFYTSDRLDLTGNDKPNLNIYSFQLPETVRSSPVNYVEGTVRDIKNQSSLEVKIQLFDNLTGKWITDYITKQDGHFLLALPSGKNYNLSIDHPGYAFYSNQFDLESNQSEYNPMQLTIDLIPLEIIVQKDLNGEYHEIILRNIFFETGSAVLDTMRSELELKNLLNFLNKNSTLKIQIEGHTDNVGSIESNKTLSIDRAKVVQDYLLKSGIVENRIIYRGFGEARPVDTNETPEGRKNNRRTSFKIIDN